jgi:hypothetical protein
MKRLLLVCGAALCALVLVQSVPVASQEMRFGGEAAKPLTEEIRQAYLTAYRQTRIYNAARALNAEAVETEIAKLREESGLTIDFTTRNFRTYQFRPATSADRMLSVTLRSSQATVRYRVDRQYDDERHRIEWLLKHTERASDHEEVSLYLFSGPQDFPELDFDFVDRVIVRHPLARPEFSCEETSIKLSDFVREFCVEHDVDYVIAAMERDPVISLRLRNRSFAECLEIAAKAADVDIAIWMKPHDRKVMFEGFHNLWREEQPLAALVESVRRDLRQVQAPVTVHLPAPKKRK